MRRPLLQMLREEHGFSERRACEAVGLSRSVARYERRPDRDEEVIGKPTGRQQGNACDFFLPAEDYAALQDMPQDLIFNIASMQEMNLSVVKNYMNYIRRIDGGRPLFYCCNRRDKHVPDGEVVRFAEYGWQSTDEILLDEPCPWCQNYPAGFTPRWYPFDGDILHRLVRLAPR